MDEPTDVMSLDELMDLAAERGTTASRETATMPIPASLPTTPAAPAPLNPAAATLRPAPRPAARPPARAAARPKPAHTGPDLRERMLADARRAYDASLARSRSWLETGDNRLIVMTAAVAVLLLLVVAAL